MWWKLHLQGNGLDEIVGSIEDWRCGAGGARGLEAGRGQGGYLMV